MSGCWVGWLARGRVPLHHCQCTAGWVRIVVCPVFPVAHRGGVYILTLTLALSHQGRGKLAARRAVADAGVVTAMSVSNGGHRQSCNPGYAIFTDGVGRRCRDSASLISGCKHVFHLDESRIRGLAGRAQRRGVTHAYPVCHCEERSDMAISPADRHLLRQRDCHAALAMTGCGKWVRMSVASLFFMDAQDYRICFDGGRRGTPRPYRWPTRFTSVVGE